MTFVNSRADIETYVFNSHPDICEHNLDAALVAVIQGADHPGYGTDWSDWLDASINDLRAEVVG